MSKSLSGKIALVTGGSRGIGRGIAIELAEAGATVYVTGRKSSDGQQQNVEETINSKGGKAIAVHVDHANPDEIEKLFQRISKEQNGQLDILVNNAYSAVGFIFTNSGKKFYEIEGKPENAWDTVNNVGLRAVYVASFYAAKLMVPRKSGVIINISSPGGLSYLFNAAYGIGKAGVDRLTADTAIELKEDNVTVLSLWPGAVNTEIIQNAKKTGKSNPLFENAESVQYSGRVIVHLLKQPTLHSLTGQIVLGPLVAKENNIIDIDGEVKLFPLFDLAKPFIDKWNSVRTRKLTDQQP